MAELKDLFIAYYDQQLELKKVAARYDDLLVNPVTYNNETDVGHLERMMAYTDELEEAKKELDDAQRYAMHDNRAIMEILDTLGVPPENKIAVQYGATGKIYFWYDEHRYIYYKGPVYEKGKRTDR